MVVEICKNIPTTTAKIIGTSSPICEGFIENPNKTPIGVMAAKAKSTSHE